MAPAKGTDKTEERKRKGKRRLRARRVGYEKKMETSLPTQKPLLAIQTKEL
jgi:hypothetical protein